MAGHAPSREVQQKENPRVERGNQDAGHLSTRVAEDMIQSYHGGAKAQEQAAGTEFNNLVGANYNPNAGGAGVRNDVQVMIDRATTPEVGGSKSWREGYMNKLQDKINGNTPEAAQIRDALGLKQNEQFNWKEYGKTHLDMTPIPGYKDAPRREGAKLDAKADDQMLGHRAGDQAGQTTPAYTKDGTYRSDGKTTNADGTTTNFYQNDTVDGSGHNLKSERTYDGAGANIKVGDTTVKGVHSETTVAGQNGEKKVTVQTVDGKSFNYTIDARGGTSFDAPDATKFLGPKDGSSNPALFPTGRSWEKGFEKPKGGATNDFAPGEHVYEGSLSYQGNSRSPEHKTDTTRTDTVDANGHLTRRTIDYKPNGYYGSNDLASVKTESGKDIQLGNVTRTVMDWDSQAGGWRVQMYNGNQRTHILHMDESGTKYLSGN